MLPTHSAKQGELKELRELLIRLGRRLRLRDGLLTASRTLWWAVLAAALVQLLARLTPLERAWLWSLAPFGLWAVLVLGHALLRPMPLLRVARRCDAELSLKERLSTAVALQPTFQPLVVSAVEPSILPVSHSSLLHLQLHDTLSTTRAIQPRQAFPLRVAGRSLLLAAVLCAATIALAVIPNPMDAVLQERVAVRQAAQETARKIEELRETIASEDTELDDEQRAELLRQLAELARKLRENPGQREQALADLSALEETLRRQLEPGAEARQAALEQLAANLAKLAGQQQTDEQESLNQAAQALADLAAQMGEMDAAQREALATTLQQMASQAAATDPALAQALSALAEATRQGDTDAAAQAAQNGAQALRQAESDLAMQRTLARALNSLQNGRQTVARAGQGQGQGQATTGQSGQGQQGQNQGQQGQGQRAGGPGGTQARTLPPGNASGRAQDPNRPNKPVDVGELPSVYVPRERGEGSGEEEFIPGQEGSEGQTETRQQEGPLPGAETAVLVPYSQVYYEYLETAAQAMEREYIPASLKDYVREYFSRLEP
ncbi:MAG: hypothetical protein NUW24_06030 [Anaerolineae bacterium]|jgi:hypothetical protein|nr:hypothetical protein [Anaerolineae bacterium]MDH7473904.1 hypothetical protein [Anaerolineae bacterium]